MREKKTLTFGIDGGERERCAGMKYQWKPAIESYIACLLIDLMNGSSSSVVLMGMQSSRRL